MYMSVTVSLCLVLKIRRLELDPYFSKTQTRPAAFPRIYLSTAPYPSEPHVVSERSHACGTTRATARGERSCCRFATGYPAVMLSRPLVTVLLVASADALRVDTISRRALLGKATAGVLAAGPLAAFAAEVKTKLEQASDGEVYERATQGNLGVARVIKRAEEGTLVLGKGALPYRSTHTAAKGKGGKGGGDGRKEMGGSASSALRVVVARP